MGNNVKACRSTDGRLRTENYRAGGAAFFSIAEMTTNGSLVTEFKENGEVVNQVYADNKDSLKALANYLGGEVSATNNGEYAHVKVAASCSKCGTESIERELDQKENKTIASIPVVPLFICKKCKSKYYSLSDAYLQNLIVRRESLFEAAELKEKNADENKFVSTLQEYVIRIFASKKIQRLHIKG